MKRGIVVGLVCALAVGGLAVHYGRGYLAQRAACDDLTAYMEQHGETSHLGDGSQTIAVLGDSYSAGIGLEDRGRRWVVQLADLDHAAVTVDAVGSTGFTNPGPCGGESFADRTEAIGNPDLLILQGGLNDIGASPASETAAAGDLIDEAGTSPVLVVGPVDSPARDGEAKVDAALRRAASEHGAEYLSMLHAPVEFLSDGVHMTPEGHRVFAKAVADAAQAAMAPSMTPASTA